MKIFCKKYFVFILIFFNTSHSKFEDIISKFSKKNPEKWAEKVKGVRTLLDTKEKVIALTFDACGSKTDSCDYRYINFLIKKKIPATLFISGTWIDKFPNDFKKLYKNKLFDIQNHGSKHLPCSVNGKSIYKIKGTCNVAEVIEEVENNAQKIKKITGKKPIFYRSGTAYYDEVAVEVVNALGYQVIGFSVLGDAGTTWSQQKVKEAILKAKPGSIIILHMNRPEKECAIGAIQGIKELKKQGFKFVKLRDYNLK